LNNLPSNWNERNPEVSNTSKPEEFQPSLSIVRNRLEDVREALALKMRGAMLEFAHGLYADEVEQLCGRAFSRKKEGQAHRGGWDPSTVYVQGQRVAVQKPRVKRGGEEVVLETHTALQDFDLLCDRIMKHMITGVSTRDYEPLLDEMEGGLGLKRSSVSKAFKAGSKEILDEMNGSSLSDVSLCAMMIDGVHFGDRTVITVLGVEESGKKLILGLREGDTENSEVIKDLFQSLIDRGLNREQRMLFVTDGSGAIRKAIRRVFGKDAIVQRCTVHKARNIVSYLPSQNHAEFYLRWKRLHAYTKYDAAIAEYKMLCHWLGQINSQSLASLEEACEETLTLIRLGIGATLRKSLMTTNPIESAFSRARAKSSRVRNWKSGPDQVSRWAAATLKDAESRFRKLRGWRDIPSLIEKLNSNDALASSQGVA
jgi:putative transposase